MLYLTSEQAEVLNRFRLDYGRRWKSVLRSQWQASNYPGSPAEDHPVLQTLRNSSHFGPAGLFAWPNVEVLSG